ncbi:NUAK family SNF1-like kinase 1 isoform X1 [Paramormyrops kingsleyae]|uniref:non-specific serine/threonine protein kinase n=2 Tax=Paramormyrops kingsleyae TaxID=1676925 RepID=A0A3B3QJP1_9TELE|nr:NUAK family SNF1-like kinase 1 [Paramormyrops kingsleyae]
MGRREAAGDSSMSMGDRTELGSLQGIALSGDCASSASGDTARQMDKKGSCQPARPPEEVKKHQHKHNLKHRYELLETLGKGTYGKVKKAIERRSGKTVAIKSIRKERITDELDRMHIQREIEIISLLRHPNIIRIHEVFESKDKIVIVMEFARGGELYDYVNTRNHLPETEARKIFRQVASAVHYCHNNGVVHRDLKLENILLDQDFNVKLADFGLSSHYQKGQLLKTYCGSPLYASPEIVQGLPYQGPEVDCWALGVLLYALVYGTMPFDGASYGVLVEQISQAKYKKPQPPSDACALINWMLKVNVEERATVEDITNHWWVNWGFQEPVCDCPSSQASPSPLLARYIDWQNRTLHSAPSGHSPDPAADFHVFLGFPPKPVAGRMPGTLCLKKSRKENVILHPSPGDSTLLGMDQKKPKGILKTQSSFDKVCPPQAESADALPRSQDSPYHSHHTSVTSPGNSQTLPKCLPSAKMPKKGILKKLYVRESGYSSSPERGGSLDRAGCQKNLIREGAPTQVVVRRKKGILKRNGKFSTSLDLSDERVTSLQFSASLQQLLLSSGGSCATTETYSHSHHSRPSSVISDDSLLSSDSFDLLDLSANYHRRLHFQDGLTCSSEEELENQKEHITDSRAEGRQTAEEDVCPKPQETNRRSLHPVL